MLILNLNYNLDKALFNHQTKLQIQKHNGPNTLLKKGNRRSTKGIALTTGPRSKYSVKENVYNAFCFHVFCKNLNTF